jgi:hypothetical protein
MKTFMFSIIMLISMTHSKKLVGRWESISAAGNTTGIVFKEDGSFEGYVNKKPFVTGMYTLRDSIFEMSDNGCMGATGTYKLHFFSNNDSFRIILIQDACEPRGKGTNNRVFGRVKQ